MNDARQHAHELIGRMPEAQVNSLVQFLETVVYPVAAALRDAALDGEPETDEEKAAVAEARQWLLDNGDKGLPHSEAMRRLGLE